MRDICDVEFAAEVEVVAAKAWSELPQEFVQKNG